MKYPKLQSTKSKKILVTAGSSWVRIDDVRIITNRFTGSTGLFLARGLKKRGHDVTLLINPHACRPLSGVKIVKYRYFEDLKNNLRELLRKDSFDAIIHMAAVSDYLIAKPSKGKIPSGKARLQLMLCPAPKLIKYIRNKARESILIQFKLEIKRKGLIEKAKSSMLSNKSDYVVANALEELGRGYKGVLIGNDNLKVPIASKEGLVAALERVIL